MKGKLLTLAGMLIPYFLRAKICNEVFLFIYLEFARATNEPKVRLRGRKTVPVGGESNKFSRNTLQALAQGTWQFRKKFMEQ